MLRGGPGGGGGGGLWRMGENISIIYGGPTTVGGKTYAG